MIAVGSNICPHEPLSAFSTMLLNSPDPAIRDYITFITPGAVPVPDEILPSNGTVYDKDELFPFISKGDTTSFSITATITFPTKGGWKEDSTYIFTLVNSLNLGGNYKIAE